MQDIDILTKILEWAKSATYVSKNGSREVKAYARGYEKGISDAKEKILEIINSEK
jgi:hypothetical protein